jgi:hypothetical protein
MNEHTENLTDNPVDSGVPFFETNLFELPRSLVELA